MRILVRAANGGDPVLLSAAFAGTLWDRLESFRSHLAEHERGARVFLIGLADDRVAGHGSLVWESIYPPFRDAGIPEVQDLNVAPAFRRRGVAAAILDSAERLAAERCDRIGIGVGLHPGYGAAQRLYSTRGYGLDGRGVFRLGRFASEGEVVPLDDDSVLHFTRSLLRAGASDDVRVAEASPAFSDWEGLLALLRTSYEFMEGRIDPPSSLLRMDGRDLQTKAREEVLILAHDAERLVGCAFARLRDECVYVGKVAVDASDETPRRRPANAGGGRGDRTRARAPVRRARDARRARGEPGHLRGARLREGRRVGAPGVRPADEHRDAEGGCGRLAALAVEDPVPQIFVEKWFDVFITRGRVEVWRPPPSLRKRSGRPTPQRRRSRAAGS